IIRAVGLLKHEIRGLRFEIYGGGSYVNELKRLSKELGVESRVYFNEVYLPVEEMPPLIANADVGVIAVKQTPHGEIMQTNKMYDFVTMRRPVLISRTRAVERYFGAANCFETFTPDDEYDAAQGIRRLYRDPKLAERLTREALIACAPYRW